MHAGWDQHDHPYNALKAQCHDSRGIFATLVQDLKDRGLSIVDSPKVRLSHRAVNLVELYFLTFHLNKVTP